MWSEEDLELVCKPLTVDPAHLTFFFLLLFLCAYKAWFISPPCPHPLPYHPLHPLPLPPTSYFYVRKKNNLTILFKSYVWDLCCLLLNLL
jgi:hypothetical protein